MKQSSTLVNGFAFLLGLFLLIEGIWGLSSEVVFGIFTTNTTHAVIHLALGLIAIVLGVRKKARSFCIFLGLLLAIVGILRFIPGADSLVIKILNVNEAVAYLNIAIGSVLLILVFSSRRDVPKY
jgi:uncharacterized membrane protein